jgi:hypothetical protein
MAPATGMPSATIAPTRIRSVENRYSARMAFASEPKSAAEGRSQSVFQLTGAFAAERTPAGGRPAFEGAAQRPGQPGLPLVSFRCTKIQRVSVRRSNPWIN